MSEIEQIAAHAERIRASDGLGRSDQLRRLFDYLVECSRSGKVPKESVLAVEVFGRGTDFDVSQDAAVRVYIHKLRRKFDEFYATRATADGARLTIPKGEYRLVLEHPIPLDANLPTVSGLAAAGLPGGPAAQPAMTPAASSTAALAALPPAARRNPWQTATFTAIGALAVFALAGGLWWQQSVDAPFKGVRDSAIWSRFLSDNRPITVVLGDYYIFAEADEFAQPRRLVRDFAINSRGDLDQYLMEHPDLSDRYRDAQLAYLPTASASVMADIMPLLASTHRPVHVTMMSDLSPVAIKTSDVVYVGYLSGLGMLFDATFSGSRFAIGGSFDELLDGKTHRQYISQAGDRYARPNDDVASGNSSAYREYSLITRFEGPSGNEVLVIAGMRDIGLMQAGEAITSPRSLRQLSEHLPAGAAFEALYEVTGINSTNMASKLLVTSVRTATDPWGRTAADGADHLGAVTGSAALGR